MPGSILDDLDLTLEELTTLVRANPSLRGMIVGYAAEAQLEKQWLLNKPNVTNIFKADDHDRNKKGDREITYKGHSIRLEVKSLQTAMVKKVGPGQYVGKAQCDASDRRTVKLPGGSTIETTCLLFGEFDILAINLFAFENKWRYAFALNCDLPSSRYKKYTPAQQKHLISTLIEVSWPPKPPFKDEPFSLMDSIISKKKKKS